MKGIKAVVNRTKSEQAAVNGRNIWIPLYYNSDTDTVYMRAGEGRELVTHLLNEVKADDIKEIVNKWKWR